MANHPFTTRSSVLGLPIGPRKPDWSTILGSTLGVALVAAIVRVGRGVLGTLAGTAEQLTEPLREGKELVQEGEDVVREGENLLNRGEDVAHEVGRTGRALSG